MYSFRYRFYPNRENVDDYFRYLGSYLCNLYNNGQILPDWSLARTEDHWELACIAPDTDSLDKKYYNDSVTQDYNKLLEYSKKEPEYSLIGLEVALDDVCHCDSHSSYVLFTTCINDEPPVVCGDCGDSIPLYKLSHTNDYWNILDWANVYRACDKLYINSGIGERFGLRQMTNVKSQLTTDGLEICRDLSTKLGKPFYYYLHIKSRRNAKNCPSCGSAWSQLDDRIANRFNMLCDKCGLVAIFPD